jgi:preprotein translocase subunit SecB
MSDNFSQYDVVINGQYIKDLSFENPNSPQSLTLSNSPQINLNVDVQVTRLTEKDFEVNLHIEAKATESEKEATVFLISLDYAGIFNMNDIPAEYYDNVLANYCPTLLFPYARAIISNITREAGFPPLMLSPVDFSGFAPAKNTGGEEAKNA